MSFWLGEWQADDWTSQYATTSYPGQAAPSSAPASESSGTATPETISAVTAETDGLEVRVERDGVEADLWIAAPAPSDVDEYIADNARRADQLTRGERPIEAIVTFTTPLTAERFSELASLDGVSLRTYEAIGSVPEGLTLTIGGGADSVNEMADRFTRDGATGTGIVAADVVVSGSGYETLATQPDVLIVDVAPTTAITAARGRGALAGLVMGAGHLDVVLNDLYWLHANLDR